ncbi:MAG: tRNA 4-thiouridine(8) synthase ThiI [bacterium]
MPKAVALYSGGLDSVLAIKLMLDQGIRIEALTCITPFFGCISRNPPRILEGNPLVGYHCIDITETFLDVLRRPRYGFGRHLNPCIDCRILMLKHAKAFMEETGADFVLTGEVLGQRPMSQRRDTLRLIEIQSGLEGKLLRPLSARLLQPTEPEKEGLVDRGRLLDLQGRSRKTQIHLAESIDWQEYPTPGGGCLLTDAAFADKVKPLLEKGFPDPGILKWVKIGRHFTLPGGIRLVVGRNKEENERIGDMARTDALLISPTGIPGPTAILLGNPSHEALRLAASITASYSDHPTEGDVAMAVSRGGAVCDHFMVSPIPREQVRKYRAS